MIRTDYERDEKFIEACVALHGEPYRSLIEDALEWLGRHEPDWRLDQRLDREEFIRGLVRTAEVKK